MKGKECWLGNTYRVRCLPLCLLYTSRPRAFPNQHSFPFISPSPPRQPDKERQDKTGWGHTKNDGSERLILCIRIQVLVKSKKDVINAFYIFFLYLFIEHIFKYCHFNVHVINRHLSFFPFSRNCPQKKHVESHFTPTGAVFTNFLSDCGLAPFETSLP